MNEACSVAHAHPDKASHLAAHSQMEMDCGVLNIQNGFHSTGVSLEKNFFKVFLGFGCFSHPLCFIPLSVYHYSVQYNSLLMKNKTAEEAYLEMLKPAEMVTLKVQQRVDEFNRLKDTAGDGFYIRYCGSLLPRHIYTLLVNFT